MHILLIVGVALVLTQTAAFATSIYLHRALAHRSLTMHPAADLVFRTILWLMTGQRRQEWVAIHRKHHAFTDVEGDPHSPRLLGYWRVQLLNAYYYVVACRDRRAIEKFAPDLAPDRLDRALFSHGVLGLGIGVTALCLLMGLWAGLLAAGLHAVLYVAVLAPMINAVGHWRGQRNYDNSARNSRVLGCLTAGEALHNNHHAYPRAPRFSVRAGEIDPSWPVIRALAALRLLVINTTPVLLPRAPARSGALPEMTLSSAGFLPALPAGWGGGVDRPRTAVTDVATPLDVATRSTEARD